MNGEQAPTPPQDELEAQASDAARRVVDGDDAVDNDEYLQHHPNAVQDKDKAEVMAYASKTNEQNVVGAVKDAQRFSAASVPGAKVDDSIAGTIRRYAQSKGIADFSASARALRDDQVEQAKEFRSRADKEQEAAGADYDEHQAFMSSGVDSLMSGQQLQTNQEQQSPQVGRLEGSDEAQPQ